MVIGLILALISTVFWGYILYKEHLGVYDTDRVYVYTMLMTVSALVSIVFLVICGIKYPLLGNIIVLIGVFFGGGTALYALCDLYRMVRKTLKGKSDEE